MKNGVAKFFRDIPLLSCSQRKSRLLRLIVFLANMAESMGSSSDPGGGRADNFSSQICRDGRLFLSEKEGIYVEEKLNY